MVRVAHAFRSALAAVRLRLRGLSEFTQAASPTPDVEGLPMKPLVEPDVHGRVSSASAVSGDTRSPTSSPWHRGWHPPTARVRSESHRGRREKRRREGGSECAQVIRLDRLALTRTSSPWGGWYPRGCSRPIGVPREAPAPAAQCRALTTAARSEREGWKFHEIVAFLMRSNGPWSLTSLYSSK